MNTIRKLNDKLKYTTQVNNRHIVAAICAQEFKKILSCTTTYAEKKFIESLINQSLREMHSNIPMKLFEIDEIIGEYTPYKGTMTTNMSTEEIPENEMHVIYYGIVGNTMNRSVQSSNSSTIHSVTTKSNEYFVYKYPKALPKLSSIVINDAYNVI